jgi:hypothetical protein
METTNFKELDNLTAAAKKKYHDSLKAHDNEAYKNERARRIRKSVSSRYNADNSVTVTVTDGYGNVTGEETFTKDDLFILAQEKGESIINKKVRDKKRAERNKVVDDTLEDICKAIGLSVLSIAGGMMIEAAGKKSAKLVKSLARKIAK